MTERTHPSSTIRAGSSGEAWFIASSAALLAGLAVADRLAAWMIGEFPTSAALWELRFEYLRPIGVFYDIAAVRLGSMSGLEFSALLLLVAAALVVGALSRIRLVRAASMHALLASCLALCGYSLIDVPGPVGSPSSSYGLLGAAIALPILGSCLRIHAEYVGRNPMSSRYGRRLRIAAMRMRRHLSEFANDLIESLVPATSRLQLALARRAIVGNRRLRR